MMEMFSRTQLMKKMHDGTPSNGPISWKKEAGRQCPLHPLVLSIARVDFFTRQGFILQPLV
jgi:hypothetical protein